MDNLKSKPSKCHFAKTLVNFFGFVASADGVSPVQGKIDVVKSYLTHTCVKDIVFFVWQIIIDILLRVLLKLPCL